MDAMTELPSAEHIADTLRWMNGFDARMYARLRKEGWRVPGRLRLARFRLWELWQVFVGLDA